MNAEQWLVKAAKGKAKNDCWEVPPLPCGRRRQVNFNGKMQPLSRIAWIKVNGDVPSNVFICHTCDNGNCVNLRHLYAGDIYTNARDRAMRGRQSGCAVPGNTHASSRRKLTQQQAEEIRVRRAAGEKLRVLAAVYGVSEDVVMKIAKNRRYTNA